MPRLNATSVARTNIFMADSCLHGGEGGWPDLPTRSATPPTDPTTIISAPSNNNVGMRHIICALNVQIVRSQSCWYPGRAGLIPPDRAFRKADGLPCARLSRRAHRGRASAYFRAILTKEHNGAVTRIPYGNGY